MTTLPLAPRIPAGPDSPFHCEPMNCVMAGRHCVERQSARVRATGNAKDKTPRVPERLRYCASGKCEQGREVLVALGKPTSRALLQQGAYGMRRLEAEKIAQHTAAGRALVAKVESSLAKRRCR